jgi:hypothetical protein
VRDWHWRLRCRVSRAFLNDIQVGLRLSDVSAAGAISIAGLRPIRHGAGGWEFSLSARNAETVTPLVRSLFTRLLPHMDAIRRLAGQATLIIRCRRLMGALPVLVLPADGLRDLTALGGGAQLTITPHGWRAWRKPGPVKLHVLFRLRDFEGDPGALTGLLDLTPTRTFRHGEVKPGTRMTYRGNGWEFGRVHTDMADIATAIHEVVATVHAKAALLDTRTDARRSLEIVLYGDRWPPVHLHRETVSLLADLRCPVGIDLY